MDDNLGKVELFLVGNVEIGKFNQLLDKIQLVYLLEIISFYFKLSLLFSYHIFNRYGVVKLKPDKHFNRKIKFCKISCYLFTTKVAQDKVHNKKKKNHKTFSFNHLPSKFRRTKARGNAIVILAARFTVAVGSRAHKPRGASNEDLCEQRDVCARAGKLCT